MGATGLRPGRSLDNDSARNRKQCEVSRFIAAASVADKTLLRLRRYGHQSGEPSQRRRKKGG